MRDVEVRELTLLLESIFAQARTGLAFSTSPYDINRYNEILASLGKIASLLSSGDDISLASLVSYLNSTNIEIGDQEYVTPKVAVAVAAFNNVGEVLLVRRNEELWTLPGGYADVGLDPIENARKEVREETGLEIEVVSLIGVYDTNISQFPLIGRQVYTLAFYSKLLDGVIKADPIETRGASFFDPCLLPNTPLATRLQIEQALRFFQGELLPAFIDHKRNQGYDKDQSDCR
jgi:ADP-ribose pyrophosphatase YjhB (NUDIX family)